MNQWKMVIIEIYKYDNHHSKLHSWNNMEGIICLEFQFYFSNSKQMTKWMHCCYQNSVTLKLHWNGNSEENRNKSSMERKFVWTSCVFEKKSKFKHRFRWEMKFYHFWANIIMAIEKSVMLQLLYFFYSMSCCIRRDLKHVPTIAWSLLYRHD